MGLLVFAGCLYGVIKIDTNLKQSVKFESEKCWFDFTFHKHKGTHTHSMHKASTDIQSRSTNTPQLGIQYFIQWYMNRKSHSITYRLIHCLKSFGLFSPATEERKKPQYNWHRYARTENQHTLVIRMCSLRCRRRLVEGHPSSQSALSPQCASPTRSYAACTNAHMYLFHLAQICCILPHLSMWPLTGWQTPCTQLACVAFSY